MQNIQKNNQENNIDIEKIKLQAKSAILELLESAKLNIGEIIVVGGSSSEVGGGIIGKNSNFEIAQIIIKEFKAQCDEAKVFLAVQCCEHLNRALVVERTFAIKNNLEIVSAVPAPKAGGGFATAAAEIFKDFVLVEFIKANAGIDVGDTFIGMHLKHVAVPIRPKQNKIGCAHVTMAITRPKYIGGARAQY